MPTAVDPQHTTETLHAMERSGVDRDKAQFVNSVLGKEVPKSPPGVLEAKIQAGEPLSLPECNQLACELAACSEQRLAAVLAGAWSEYVAKYPHLNALTSKIDSVGYNPLLQPPAEVVVIKDFRSVASMATSGATISQGVSEAAQRQIAVTQLLTPAYADNYPYPGNAEGSLEAWAHEGSHKALNGVYARISSTSDRIEQQFNPGHLTFGDRLGNRGAITSLQEIAVRLSASELLGTQVTSLPNVLLSANYVTILPELRAQARQINDPSRSEDDKVWDLWYDHPLRAEVSRLCRTFVEARINGYNPLELCDEVNKVILTIMPGPPIRRAGEFTYQRMTDIAETMIRIGRIQPTMPPLGTKAEEIDVFKNRQRQDLIQAVASNWLKSSSL